MLLITRLKRVFNQYFFDLNGISIALILLFYIAGNWLLLLLAQETQLLAMDQFFYWLMVTASTVGYGDLSPISTAGKLVVAFFTIPMGLSMFALVMGKSGGFLIRQWQKGMRGEKQMHFKDHIVVIGWNPKRTLYLLDLLQGETQQSVARKVLLCSTEQISNPLPDQVAYVKVAQFNHLDEMKRACIEQAAVIIIDTELDDVTLTTALFCANVNPQANLVAYFVDPLLSDLLKKHCPAAECTPSLSVELLVKAAMDPGSSTLHQQLLSVNYGVTQFSISYPDSLPDLPMRKLFNGFKDHYNATVIGMRRSGRDEVELNPDLQQSVERGCQIYYIAERRIKQLQWDKLND